MAPRIARAAKICLLAFTPLLICITNTADAREIKIGVLAKRDSQKTLLRWSPLADYLSQSVKNNHFTIVPLGFNDIQQAVSDQQIDFVLTNPYMYIILEAKYGVSSIATLKNRYKNRGYDVFGSVIFSRSDRSDLNSIKDIRGKRLMAVDEQSLGGYQITRLEMKQHGIELDKDLTAVQFGKTHDAVVYAVRDGKVDAGTVSTGILERMADEGLIQQEEFRVLPPLNTAKHKHKHNTDAFSLAHSTALYPEWPFAKIAKIPEQLARKVALALLHLSADHPAAQSASITGWTVPQNYHSIHHLMQQLRVGIHAKPVIQLNFMDLLREQWLTISAVLVLLMLLTSSIIYAVRSNRNLRMVHKRLENEICIRQQAELKLVNQRDQLDIQVRDGTREIEYLRLNDALTSLPNRLLLTDRIDRMISSRRSDKSKLAVIIMDTDSFREVNDSLGHHHGDLLLQQIAQRLLDTCQMADTISRFSGDQFAILLNLSDLDQQLDDAIEHIIATFDQPFAIEELQIHLSVSLGIACYPQHGKDTDTLLRQAEVAMYMAKNKRKAYVYYDPEQDPFSKQRLVMSSQLKKAICENQLVLFYQPKVDAQTGQLVGLEALVRWLHPELGIIPPDQFIPLAEQSGLIQALTQWVLNAALRQSYLWKKSGRHIPVAVNLSALNLLNNKLAQQIRDLLDAWGLEPSCLELEVTETSMMVERQHAIKLLGDFHDMGISISIDDFGTGYSSLSYLQQLPVDVLKIDRSFIKHLSASPANDAITHAIIQLAHSMSLKVVAEGVETEQTLKYLQKINCDIVQGYYIDKPLTADEIQNKWLVRLAG